MRCWPMPCVAASPSVMSSTTPPRSLCWLRAHAADTALHARQPSPDTCGPTLCCKSSRLLRQLMMRPGCSPCHAVSPAVSPGTPGAGAAWVRGSAVLPPGRLGRIAGAGAGIRPQRQQQHGEGVARWRHRVLLHGRDQGVTRALITSRAVLLARQRDCIHGGLPQTAPLGRPRDAQKHHCRIKRRPVDGQQLTTKQFCLVLRTRFKGLSVSGLQGRWCSLS